MENQENDPEETPENPIQITVTEEEFVNNNPPQHGTESVQDKNQSESGDKDAAIDKNIDEESQTLKVPGTGKRRKTLAELDEKHEWLSELEDKYRDVETAFISKIQYVAISNHCQKYLEKLGSDESSTQFQTEFSNLFEKFRTAFSGSQQLLNKLQENKGYMNITNAENRKLKIKLEDQVRQIDNLQKHLDSTQKHLSKIEKEKSILQRMFSEWQEEKERDKLREQESDSRIENDENEEAREKIIQLEEKLEFLNKELEFVKQRESQHRNKVQQVEDQKITVEKELNSVKYDLQKQIARAEKAEASIAEKTADLTNKNAIIRTMTEETKQIRMNLQRSKEEAKRMLKDQRHWKKEFDINAQITEKIRRDLDLREDQLKTLVNQKDVVEIELNNKRAEVFALKGDISNRTKEKNVLARKVALLEERCSDAEIKLETARKENAGRKKELDSLTKELRESESKVHELTKQKDAVSEEVMKLEQTIIQLQGEITIEQDRSRKLEKELEKSNELVSGLQENVKRLENTKQHLLKDLDELNRVIGDLRGEITRFKLRVSEANKIEVKLRQQLDEEQVKFKRLVEDERHTRKLLTESRHVSEQLQSQQIVLQKYIEQLQGLNQGLDERSKKLDIDVKSLTQQLSNTKELYKQEVKNIEEINAKLKRMDNQKQVLLENITIMEKDISNLRRKIKNLQEEKNVQNAKLIDKEEEIRKLKENNRLLQQEVTDLDKSVNERIEDIKLLKFHITEITRRNAVMNKQVEHMDTAREELSNTQARLMEEKIKSKALENEVQRPVNLHRWRILEGIDPERAQLVTKNQALQKQLILKMKELDEKEAELQVNLKQNRELADQLKRHSETDDQEKLWACKKELSARIERIKVLSGENSMFQSLCEKYRNEIMSLRDELRKFKVDEFKSKTSKRKKT